MRIQIDHATTYHFEKPIDYGLQRIRLFALPGPGQEIESWSVTVEGGREEVRYLDHHQNSVALFSFDQGAQNIAVRVQGIVETYDVAGVFGRHRSFAPLWFYCGSTPLTMIGPRTRQLMRSLGDVTKQEDIALLHDLSVAISDHVKYEVGVTRAHSSAEDALEEGAGVCQDHAHIFITVARALGYPARYVSGYLLMDGVIEQDATHAWAEVHIADLGWVGFDISNKISPDDRYVRIATGLDYKDAAPTTGMTYGAGREMIGVTLSVQQ